LYADGYISQNRSCVELVSKDKKHVESFRDFLSPSSLVKEKSVKFDGNTHLAYRVIIHSIEIVRDLIQLGCTPNKSLTLTFPKDNAIHRNLKHHFIRGYFDGDGSLVMKKYHDSIDQAFVLFVGTKNFLESLVEELSNYGISSSLRYYKKGRAYSYGISGNGNYKRFREYCYKDATIYLERKYKNL